MASMEVERDCWRERAERAEAEVARLEADRQDEVERLTRMLCNACWRCQEEGIAHFLNPEVRRWWEGRRTAVAEMTPEEKAAIEEYGRDRGRSP